LEVDVNGKGRFSGIRGNINNLVKQAQKMQRDMERVQEELKEKTVEASAGGGAVTVVATGRKDNLLQGHVFHPFIGSPSSEPFKYNLSGWFLIYSSK